MPKQIKKPALKAGDIRFRKLGTGLLIISAVFLGTVLGLIRNIVNTESKLLTTILFSTYILYVAACTIIVVVGINTYRKEENFGILFQSILTIISLITCIMNLRFALVMLFSAYGLDSAADKLMGTQTSTQFVESQYVCWISLFAGIVITAIIGISSIVKLAKSK